VQCYDSEGVGLANATGTQATRRRLQRRNRPDKGSAIKVEPIRDRAVIARVLLLLQDKPRDRCLFTLGINTAYRANELLSLRVGDVMHLTVGDTLTRKQSKTGEYRYITLNGAAYHATQQWLAAHPNPHKHQPLFISRKTGDALSVSTLAQMVKAWCSKAGASGNYASHTLRKTWGYHQRVWKNAPLSLLVRAFGHKREAQTLDYLGIVPDEIKTLYLNMELDMNSVKEDSMKYEHPSPSQSPETLIAFKQDFACWLAAMAFFHKSVMALAEQPNKSATALEQECLSLISTSRYLLDEGKALRKHLDALTSPITPSL